MVVKLTRDLYDDEQIERAKDIRFSIFGKHCITNDKRNPRNRTHIGADKRVKNTDDLLNVYLMLPPPSIPTFLSKYMSNLPLLV